MASSDTDKSHQLNYGAQPSLKRQWLRSFGLVMVVLGLAAIGWWVKKPIAHWYAKYEYARLAEKWYASAAIRADQPSLLKYTDDPADALPGGFTSSTGGLGFSIRAQDPFLDRLPMFNGNGDPTLSNHWCILFSHERTNSIGMKRLIMASMGCWQGSKISLNAYQIGHDADGIAGTLKMSGKNVELAGIATSGSLRLFAGQVDPTDPAKFYIPFQSNGRSGRICGTFVAGPDFSINPEVARAHAGINSEVEWKVMLNAPATTRSVN